MCKRSFINFSALKHDSIHGRCRIFMGLDDSYLKRPHGGVLLSVTLDTNNRVFLIVICICEGENLESLELVLGV